MERIYPYIGPEAIARRAAGAAPGTPITSSNDVLRWARETGQDRGRIVATFVVDVKGVLQLADRHSEHVACAAGQPVRAAGEMTFWIEGSVTVESVSNQSIGYCPEPESWPAVEEALRQAGLAAPEGYSPALIFRRCPGCESINVVKDGEYVCVVCDTELR